jgi:hypothetical protein
MPYFSVHGKYHGKGDKDSGIHTATNSENDLSDQLQTSDLTDH